MLMNKILILCPIILMDGQQNTEFYSAQYA